MTIISKVHVDDIPNLRSQGVEIKFLPLSVISALYGEDEMKAVGDFHYAYINIDTTLEALIALQKIHTVR